MEIEALPKNVQARLVANDGNNTLEGNGTVFAHGFNLEEEWKGYIELLDLDKPERAPVTYDDLVLAPIPDEPPLLRLRNQPRIFSYRQMPPFWWRCLPQTIMEYPMSGCVLSMRVTTRRRPSLLNPWRKKSADLCFRFKRLSVGCGRCLNLHGISLR